MWWLTATRSLLVRNRKHKKKIGLNSKWTFSIRAHKFVSSPSLLKWLMLRNVNSRDVFWRWESLALCWAARSWAALNYAAARMVSIYMHTHVTPATLSSFIRLELQYSCLNATLRTHSRSYKVYKIETLNVQNPPHPLQHQTISHYCETVQSISETLQSIRVSRMG